MVGLLATGGMAEVYLALSGELSGFRTLVVVKRILPHLASNEDFIRMFFDEARIVAMLDHPNIVRIIEVGQEGDEYFLAMEVIQGKPLSALIRAAVKQGTPLTQPQAAFLVAQAAKGLGHAHQLSDASGAPLNIVHRDVSPQNILVSFDGGVKVIDFGVARAMGRISETRPGGLKGKLQYMAPEQAAGGRVDRRADVFALGVVLWEAICGRRPFQRRSDVDMLRALVEEPIPPPSRYVKISARLEGIVLRALERHPADRFDTAQALALELERFAFASSGFNPTQISTTMKGLFTSDCARWKKTMAAVRDLEGEPEEWIDTSGTYITPNRIDLKTRDATMALHPLAHPNGVAKEFDERLNDSRNDDSANGDSRSLASLELDLLPRRRARRRHLLVGGLTLAGVVLVALAVAQLWPHVISRLLSRTGVAAAIAVSQAGEPREIERLRSTAQVEPLAESAPAERSPSETALAAVEAPALSSTSAPVEGPAPSRAELVVGAGAGLSEPDAPVSRRSSKRPRARARTSAGKHATAVVAAKGQGVLAYDPARVTTKSSASATSGSSAAAAASNGRVDAVVPASARKGDSEGADSCSVRIGTTPWSEVWIDGKNTGKHTPFLEVIPCGKRKFTFKRPDLALEKTVVVDATADQTYKQSFSLQAD